MDSREQVEAEQRRGGLLSRLRPGEPRTPARIDSVLDGRCVAPDLVEAWLTDPAEDLRDLDRLLRSTTDGLRRWLVGRAGSGSLAYRPRFLVRAATLIEVLRSGRDEAPGASTRAGRRTVSIWPLLLVGLLRTVCAVRVQAIADVAQIGLGTAEVGCAGTSGPCWRTSATPCRRP